MKGRVSESESEVTSAREKSFVYGLWRQVAFIDGVIIIYSLCPRAESSL